MTSKTHFKPKSAERKLTLNFRVNFSNFFFRAQKLFLDRIRCSTRKMTSKMPKRREKINPILSQNPPRRLKFLTQKK